MRIIETKAYQFNELSEESQEKVIEKLYNINVKYEEWWGSELDYWNEKLDAIGFENADIHFSGFWTQGDGASFTADINLEKIINTIVSCGYNTCDMVAFQALEKMEYHGLIELSFEIYRSNSRYAHENTCTVDMYFECYQEYISDSGHDCLEGLSNQLLSDIEEIRLNLCQEIYKSLEREYEYLTSEEVVRETIETNEYEFTEDGELI